MPRRRTALVALLVVLVVVLVVDVSSLHPALESVGDAFWTVVFWALVVVVLVLLVRAAIVPQQ